MEEKFKQFLKKQMEEEAEQIEKEVLSNESLKGIQAPETLREALTKSIREYEEKSTASANVYSKVDDCEESEESKISIEEFCEKLSEEDRESYLRWRAAEEKKKAKKTKHIYHFPRKKKAIVVVAATMVLVLAIGMTSVGGRPYWLKVADLMLGNENTVKVNTEGEDRLETTKVDEKEAYEQIKEELGIEPVQLQYMPQGMEFYDAVIEKELGNAKLFYLYKDQTIEYEICYQYSDVARSISNEDNYIERYNKENSDMNIEIKEFQVDSVQQKVYSATFKKNEVLYRLRGVIEKEEMEKIVENLFFF